MVNSSAFFNMSSDLRTIENGKQACPVSPRQELGQALDEGVYPLSVARSLTRRNFVIYSPVLSANMNGLEASKPGNESFPLPRPLSGENKRWATTA